MRRRHHQMTSAKSRASRSIADMATAPSDLLPDEARAMVGRFATRLAMRPAGERERMRAVLAKFFYETREEMWPHGESDEVTLQWLADHADVVLATIEKLYSYADD